MSGTFWSKMFPDKGGKVFWGSHFPDDARNFAYLSGYGLPGAASFAFELNGEFTVRYEWITDVIKRIVGSEQRANIRNLPKQSYSGSAVLLGSDPRKVRAYIARYASNGAQFRLGLPYEELTLSADASGTAIFVNNAEMLMCDWVKPGQYVVIADNSEDSPQTIVAIIQSVGVGRINLDVTPGAIGRAYGRVMPTMPILLQPQQGFERHPVNAEQWKIEAMAASFSFAPTIATIALGSYTVSPGLADVVLMARRFGLRGNQIQFHFISNVANPATGSLAEFENDVGIDVQINYRPGVTTLGDLANLLANSSFLAMGGTYSSSTTIASGDQIIGVFASGATAAGTVGAGASLTMYQGMPVWDRYIQLDGTVAESAHSLTRIIDMGGVPYSLSTVRRPDWGRAIKIRDSRRSVWQWLKLFLHTVCGSNYPFWLPTWRNDLTFVSKGTNVINIDDEIGDLQAWLPEQRQHIMIIQLDGTVTYAWITGVTLNVDGTWQLYIGTTISSSAVIMISWLEPSRFEEDAFDIVFKGQQFSLETKARVVP